VNGVKGVKGEKGCAESLELSHAGGKTGTDAQRWSASPTMLDSVIGRVLGTGY